MPEVIDEYFDKRGVANHCHVSVFTVDKWLTKKLLPRTWAGGRVLISKADLQAFLVREVPVRKQPTVRKRAETAKSTKVPKVATKA